MTMLVVKQIYGLTLRSCQGFIESQFKIMKLSSHVPNYSCVCRRQQTVVLPALPQKKESIHLVVDSTGLKIFGEGEWKVRQHGISKRRTWRKLHLAVDESTHEILMSVVTTNDFKDSQVFEDLIEPLEENIERVSADGAYDTFKIHEYLKEKGIDSAIPPQKNAKLKYPDQGEASPLIRDRHLLEIEEMGREEWKIAHQYHRRSLAETAMFRYKQIFGAQLKNRVFEHQATEAFIRCVALNKMTWLGRPHSCQVF